MLLFCCALEQTFFSSLTTKRLVDWNDVWMESPTFSEALTPGWREKSFICLECTQKILIIGISPYHFNFFQPFCLNSFLLYEWMHRERFKKLKNFSKNVGMHILSANFDKKKKRILKLQKNNILFLHFSFNFSFLKVKNKKFLRKLFHHRPPSPFLSTNSVSHHLSTDL